MSGARIAPAELAEEIGRLAVVPAIELSSAQVVEGVRRFLRLVGGRCETPEPPELHTRG